MFTINFLQKNPFLIMRKLLLTLLLTLLAPVLLAQNFNNEWIDYSKTYYKLRIKDDGLYRIPFSTLAQAGASNLSGSGFKMYYKGEQVPIYVSSNGSLNSNDYVEFYGEKNDGELDSDLFLFDSHQLTDETSLFTDSISYFLVWESGGSTQRYSDVTNNISNPPAKEQYFIHTENKIHKNIFYVGEPERIAGVNYNFADFEKGEGFVSSILLGQTTKTYNMNTPALFTGSGAPPASLETKVVGQNNDFFNFKDHHMRVRVDGTTYIDEIYEGHDTPTYNSTILSSDITSPRTKVVYESVGDIFSNPSEDWQSVSYTKISYPRSFNFSEYSSGNLVPSSEFYFELNDNNDSYIEITNFSGGSAPVLYDLTNNKRYIPTVQSGTYKIRLQAGANVNVKRKLFIASTNSSSISTVSSLTKTNFTNYQSIANQGDYIMISHPSLRTGTTDWVQLYANYRKSSTGGGYNVVLADIEELYDQFAWGIPKHPLAIRNFINYAVNKWSDNTKPKHLFLVGKSIGYRATTTSTTFKTNLIPTYGHQPSDNMLGVSNKYDYRPQIGIGRISANTPTDVQNYFNKIRNYEDKSAEDCTREDRLWRKHALFMATGDNNNQYLEYEEFLEDYKDLFDDAAYYGGRVLDIQAGRNYSNGFNTRPFIEEGISVFTFMGHSTGQIWKTDILKNPAGYNQSSPRYPMILSGSCFVGNIHKTVSSEPSMAETYALSNGKGAIGFLATVSFGFPSTLDIYIRELYRQFTGNNHGKPIGELIKNTLENIYIGSPTESFYEGVKATSEEFTYQGDPGLVIGNIKDKPEYIIENNYQYSFIDVDNNYARKTVPRDDVQVFKENGGLISFGDNLVEAEAGETLTFKIRTTNLGKAIVGNYNVKISRRVQGSTVATTLKDASYTSAKYESIHVMEIPYPAGTNQNATYEYIVKVDANNVIDEDCEDNNEVILRVRYAPDACNEIAGQYENLSINNIQSTYCISDPSIPLQGSINGGVFKIIEIGGSTYNGVSGFEPSFLGGGEFVVSYTVTDAATGCVFSTEESVTIFQPVAAIESIDITEVCVGDEIHLEAAPTDGQYLWNFGEAGDFVYTGSNENPILSWNSPGEKLITLKVEEDGCESTMVTQLVNVYQQVDENFTIDCEPTENSIVFTWEAEGAESFMIYGDGVLFQTLDGSVNTFTFGGLDQEQDVTIRVVAVPKGTCEQVEKILTCTTACAGEVPVVSTLAAQSNYCVNSPIDIVAPVMGGTFMVTPEGQPTIPFPNSLSTSILTAGNYTITFEYTDGGCSYSSQEYSVSITNPEVTILGNEMLCPNESLTLTVPEGYAGYEWNVPNANSFLLEVTQADTYSVIVTDQNGCTATDEFEVGMAADPNEEILSSSTTLCDGGNITLQAPFGYLSYLWSGNASNSETLVISEPGDYFVNYEDANGCIWRSDITISGPKTPTFEASCTGEEYVIEAIGDYDGYLWEDGSTEPSLAVTSGGFYYVTVTDGADCTSVGLLNVSNAPFEELAVELSTGEVNTICEGDEITLTLTNNTATDVTWTTGESGKSITVDKAGVYIATATIGGCTKTVEQLIVTDPASQPTAAFAAIGDNLCAGESVSFNDASENASAYNWTFTNELSGTVLNSTEQNPTLTFDEVGNYTVALTVDAACGTNQATETLASAFKVSDNPVVDILIEDMTVCPGESLTLTADGNGMEYTWDGGIATGVVSEEVKVQPTETTTYMVTAVNEAGCAKTASITVDVEICNFEIPNVITPNGDNFNDYWHIPQVDVGNESIYVEIYNRWGQKVYSAINYDNTTTRWDGRNDGSDDLPHGTYYYVIDLNDGTEPMTGHVTILR